MALDDSTSLSASADGIPTPSLGSGGLLAVFGTITATGGLLASSCCVLPLMLGSLGAGASVFTVLETLVAWRVPLLSASALAVGAGWLMWWRTPAIECAGGAACATPRRSLVVLGVLIAASLAVATSAGAGYLEPALLKMMRSP